MAARQNYSRSRQQYRSRSAETYTGRQAYQYGNVATQPEYAPRRHESPAKPKKQVSNQVRRNRKQALIMNRTYVVFLAVAAVLALIVCVNYVKLQSSITSRSKHITARQEELANLKEENTTRYNAVMDSVNLEEVREKAEGELGMVYASPEQIIEYEDPATDYVKQYEDIPEDGVLAQSDKNKK